MAIAGSTLECYNIRPIDGDLRIITTTRMAAHLVVKDPVKALAELQQRGHVAMWVGENNWARLRRLWAERPMTDDEKGQ